MRSSILARIPGFRQRIIPEPRVPSRGSQARGNEIGALAKSISELASDWLVLTPDIVFLPCFYGIRLWIWPEPLVAPRVRRALGTRMRSPILNLAPGSWKSFGCPDSERYALL
jgi:hypothetical protein